MLTHKRKRKPGCARVARKLPVEHTGFYPYLQRYLEYRLVNHYSPYSTPRYDSSLRQFIVWCEQRDVDDPRAITKPILERYKKHLYYSRKSNGEPLGLTTQITRLTHVKQFFKWLTRENYLLYNPASELETPRQRGSLPKTILSQEQIGGMLAVVDTRTVEGIRDRAIIETLYSCGLRRQEAADLCLHELDLKRRCLWVRQGKGGRDRLLPVGERACVWLQRYLSEARPTLLINQETPALFINNYGDVYSGDRLGAVVKRALKKAGIEVEGGAHLLRHAMATHMLENGADIRFIQKMLGHADLNTTQVYTQVSIEKLREIHRATHPARVAEKRGET